MPGEDFRDGVFRYRGLTLRYGVEVARLPVALGRVFVELDADDSTREWIDSAIAHPDAGAKILLRNLAATVVSFYDANGWTNVAQDRVLSTRQWRRLLGQGGARLLDVGAGDGEVTRELAALFGEVMTTELSRPMARRLRGKGFTCFEGDIAFDDLDAADGFDMIALQNVIDRTTHPLRLLHRVRPLLAKNGRVVVAVPVPIRPVVFVGRSRFDPAERLPMDAPDFESAVADLAAQVFAPLDYRVTAFARAPYLSRGSARTPVEILDDAIFVLADG